MKKTLEERVELAHQAKLLLANPIFKEVTQTLYNKLISALLSDQEGGIEKLKEYKLMYNAIDLLIKHIALYEKDGALARKEIVRNEKIKKTVHPLTT
jgi:hypothetical protein